MVPSDHQDHQELKHCYRRAWESDKHVSQLAPRLNQEQEDLASHAIIISNDDKCQHYMVQMYDLGQFDARTMTKWEKRPAIRKTWNEATTFFEEVVDDMETFEGESSNATARHGLSSANNATKITSTVTAALEQVVAEA